MSRESRSGVDEGMLTVQLDPSDLSVSYLSSLLRVVQAALREVCAQRGWHASAVRPAPSTRTAAFQAGYRRCFNASLHLHRPAGRDAFE